MAAVVSILAAAVLENEELSVLNVVVAVTVLLIVTAVGAQGVILLGELVVALVIGARKCTEVVVGTFVEMVTDGLAVDLLMLGDAMPAILANAGVEMFANVNLGPFAGSKSALGLTTPCLLKMCSG